MDRIYNTYRFANWLYNHKLKIFAKIIRVYIRIVFSADIPPQMSIGKGSSFPHDALGCVFHPNVKIGRNCKILHGVTMGGRSGSLEVPHIEDNVLVGVGAVIVGGVHVEKNSIIGAGSVVLKDVPKNAVVAGNPAKIIKYVNTND